MMTSTPVITFDKSARRAILDLFDKSIDQERFIVEKDNPNFRITTVDGEPLELSQFAGIRKGSEIYIKSDLVSLIDLIDALNRSNA